MSIETLIEELKQRSRETGREYDCIFIDGGGMRGSKTLKRKELDEMIIDSSIVSKINVTQDYCVKDGQKITVPRNKVLRSRIMTKFSLTPDCIISEEIERDVLDYTPQSQHNVTDPVVYIVCDTIIIGYVIGNVGLPHWLITVDSDVTSSIYIGGVEVHPLFRGTNLCKLMMKLFILYANTVLPYQQFSLTNVGQIPACRCYIKAFAECGYAAYTVKSGTPMSVEECTNDDNKLTFVMGGDKMIELPTGGRKRSTKKKIKNYTKYCSKEHLCKQRQRCRTKFCTGGKYNKMRRKYKTRTIKNRKK